MTGTMIASGIKEEVLKAVYARFLGDVAPEKWVHADDPPKAVRAWLLWWRGQPENKGKPDPIVHWREMGEDYPVVELLTSYLEQYFDYEDTPTGRVKYDQTASKARELVMKIGIEALDSFCPKAAKSIKTGLQNQLMHETGIAYNTARQHITRACRRLRHPGNKTKQNWGGSRKRT